jgi:ribonucleoside-triphosphate reductase (formate)
MRPVPRIRKRDGALVEFDESKIADAIYKAALSVGGEDRFLAEELAGVVNLFLEKSFQSAIPTIEDVQDMVERVLIETGHASTAKAYILYREEHGRMREAEAPTRAPMQGRLFEPGPVVVLDSSGERAGPLSAEVLSRKLVAQARLSPETAREVAAAVEDRAYALGLSTLSASLLSRLVDAELLSRGFLKALCNRAALSVSRARVESALFPKAATRSGTPVERIAERVLRQFSLEEHLPASCAEAHLTGRILICGLGNPSALFAASISADSLRAYGIPWLKGRFRPEAVADPRRFVAHLGRGVRGVAPHVTDGLALSRLNVLMAPLLSGRSKVDLREEAWHVLAEMAGIPGLEIDLGLAPPPLLSSRKARGPDGNPLEETYGRFAGTSLQLASAFLEVRGTAAGLGPRSELPRLTLTLGPDALEEDEVLTVMARAVGEAMAREPILVVLDREDLPILGTARARVRLDDGSRLTDTANLSVAVGGRVVVNLPHAAYRAGEGNIGAFMQEIEEAAQLALLALMARSRLVARAAAGPDGPLVPLSRGRGDGAPLLDIEGAAWSLGVLGLNEAMGYLTGEELHESSEAVKLGVKTLGLLRLTCQDFGRRDGLTVGLDAEDDLGLCRTLADVDREEFPRLADRVPARYSPGVALRCDAPVDLAVRLETEGRLGIPLRTATVRCFLREEEHPAPETVIALMWKTWQNTRVKQLLLGRREL